MGDPAGAGQTDEERNAGLESELDRSLSSFDERLARERAELDEKAAAGAAVERARERETEGGAGGAAASGVGFGRPAPPSSGEAGEGKGLARGIDRIGGDQADLPHDRPDDVGDGQDDDIVARQLREAAEKETDPELRAKLWQEYRDYKKGGG